MTEITASLVKTLREKTGAGMMDCKKALAEVDGDFEQAVDWLRKKGLAAAAKKSGRTAAEGLVAVASDASKKRCAVVEINAETDFIAKNVDFQTMVSSVATLAVAGDYTPTDLLAAPLSSGITVAEELSRLIALIGENMTLRRVTTVAVTTGVVESYIHNAVVPQLGRIGVVVALESQASSDKLGQLAKKIAMHIAATNPISRTIEEVDAQTLERERAIFSEQALASGKPPEAVQKIIEGRIRKFYEESVLLEQVFVLGDDKEKIKDAIAKLAKELGHEITLTRFVRYALGEGIEKDQTDFAAEVMAQAGVR